MSAKLEITNMPEMQRAIRQYMDATKKDLPVVTNRAAVNVALRASGLTPKADPYKIANILGRTSPILVMRKRDTKAGKKGSFRRKGFDVKEGSFAERIINARRKANGQPLLWGKAAFAAAQKFIAYRVRSAGFLRSGWIPAIRTLAPFAKVKLRVVDAKQYGQEKGAAMPAKDGFSPSAEISNSAKGVGRIGSTALNEAISIVALDMMEHARKLMIETARKHSAK